jgi:hypothetical protein
MIDIQNGDIVLGDNIFLIHRGLTKDDFLKSKLRTEVLNEQVHTFSNYFLKPQKIGNQRFTVSLFFNPQNRIDFIQMSMVSNGNIPAWDNWSEDGEQDRKRAHDQWLEDNMGKPPYRYSWGERASNYDPRSGSSMITIRYQPFE